MLIQLPNLDWIDHTTVMQIKVVNDKYDGIGIEIVTRISLEATLLLPKKLWIKLPSLQLANELRDKLAASINTCYQLQ